MILGKAMPEGKGTYRHMRIEKAENGFSIEYTEVKNVPTKNDSTFDYDDKYQSKQEVFATSEGVNMEGALDNALARYKELILANEGLAPMAGS